VNGLAYGSRVLHLVYDLVVIDAVVEVMVDDGDDVVAVSVDSSYNHSTPCYNQVLYHIEIMNMNYMS
jgi:hypothetical protein